jgi:hypothetical protein
LAPHFKEANNFLWTFKLKRPKRWISVKKDIHSKEEETGVKEKYTSTTSSKRCFDLFKINI